MLKMKKKLVINHFKVKNLTLVNMILFSLQNQYDYCKFTIEI